MISGSRVNKCKCLRQFWLFRDHCKCLRKRVLTLELQTTSTLPTILELNHRKRKDNRKRKLTPCKMQLQLVLAFETPTMTRYSHVTSKLSFHVQTHLNCIQSLSKRLHYVWLEGMNLVRNGMKIGMEWW